MTSELPPHFPGGGIATYVMEFARALVRKGHQPVVFARAPNNQQTREEVSDDGYTVVWVALSKTKGMGFDHRLSYSFAEEIERQISTGRNPPDLIEVQDYNALGYFLLKKKLLSDDFLRSVPISVFCHTPSYDIAAVNEEPRYKFPKYWVGRSERFCLLAADQIVAPSKFLASRIEAEIGRKVDVCPLPMHPIDLMPADGPKADGGNLLYVGRLEVRKGVIQLLAAMNDLWESGATAKLVMIGADTKWHAKGIGVREYLSNRYRKHVERGLLVFRGQVPRNKVADAMRWAKAVVVPSLYENFPYVCVEAMSNGAVVIASNSGGQSEMVGDDGTSGIVFDWVQDGSLRRSIEEALSLTADQRAAISANARQRIQDITDPDLFVDRRLELARRAHSSASQGKNYPFLNQLLPAERQTPKYRPRAVPATQRGKLTVVIPYFNLGDFVMETIDSVMESTCDDIEVLVVNDGSTDKKSIEVIEDAASRDWRFPLRVLTVENGGLARARNLGAEAAETEFLAFLDADDKVRPTYYERCISLLNRYQNASFVFSWLQYFGGANDVWVNFDTELPTCWSGTCLRRFRW